MRYRTIASAVLVAVAIGARAQEQPPGQILHDTYCVACHDSRVYTRDDRLARNYREIRAEVLRWQHNIGLKWDDADIETVSNYIASKFYRLACPEAC